jgi:hypothetical protein
LEERRVRSTLAHEAGHGLLHAHLFVLAPQQGLFQRSAAEDPLKVKPYRKIRGCLHPAQSSPSSA